MMTKFAELLGNAIFAAFLKWAYVKDLDELLGKVAKAVKGELAGDLPDMSKIEDIPNQVASQLSGVVTLLNGVPAQVIGAVKGLVPKWPL